MRIGDLILEISSLDKEVDSKELFSLVEKFIKNSKDEYPQIAIVSMIMDSLETSSDIFRIEKQLKIEEPKYLKFLEA